MIQKHIYFKIVSKIYKWSILFITANRKCTKCFIIYRHFSFTSATYDTLSTREIVLCMCEHNT